MVDENVPAPAPTRSDDHILPFAAWVPIRKSNYNTLTYVEKGGTYRFQLGENWFTLDANLLREALEITPIDQAYLFVSPLSGDAIMDFMNELGYLEVIYFVSSMAVNHLYQPWRAILSMINQCLTSKTFRHDRPKYPVLQMLWGIITNTNVDYAELMWEEFVQAMQAFLTDKANLGSPTKKGRKDKPHVILNCRFTKLIICEVDEVFGMPIPNELISNNIRNAPYYNAYLEMVAKHDQKVAAEKEEKKNTASAKQPKSKSATEKSSKLALASKPKPAKEKLAKSSTAKPPKPKPTKEKSTKATPLQNAGKGKVAKVRNVKSSFQLVDEPDEEPAQPEPKPEPGQEGKEPVVEATRPLPRVEGKGDDVTKELNLEDKTAEIDEDQAGSDPGKTHESRPPPEQVFMDEDQAKPDPGESSVALAGPDPEPTHDEFMADLYPNVQESLKFPVDKHVILEEPLSSSGTLSSMKNLEDAYTIGDQFINDKATKDEPEKLNVESGVVSMVTAPIY
ncbi:hypothetical protein Tco_0289502 [Tanacetum coccineum]